MARRLSPTTSEQQANHGHLDQGLAGLHFALIVHHQSPATKQPGECSFYNPPFWLLVPPAHPRGTLNNFEFPATRSLTPLGKLMPLIGLVRPDLGESRDNIFKSCQKTM